jgi:C-terminal processing protease CtpA/Prc
MGLSVSYADRRVEAVAPGSPAEEAGVRAGDTIELVNGRPVSSMEVSTFFVQLYGGLRANLTLTRVDQKQPVEVSITHDALPDGLVPHGRRLEGNIGYISLPYNGGGQVLDEYGSILQQVIREIDRTPTCGWIVDLQANAGGALSPMVLGVGPILGDGNAGTFMFANGEQIVWSYHNGGYWYGNEVLRTINNPYSLKQAMPPVAVLTSSHTASSGEATLISFKGRPQTRSFGEPTSGLPTGRDGKHMSDGALIAIATSLEADRTGHIYGADEKIAPDQYVQADDKLIGSDSDPVLLAGLTWLQTQPLCTR